MSNIHQIHALNPERRETLKHFYAQQANFFMDQIINPAGGAAALSIAVTGDDQVLTRMAGVDAAHAAVLLAEIDRVRAQLCQWVAEQAPELLAQPEQQAHGQSGKVVAMHRAPVNPVGVDVVLFQPRTH